MDKVIVVNWNKRSATRHRKDCGNVVRVERAPWGRCSIVAEAEYPIEDTKPKLQRPPFPVVDHSCLEAD